MRSGWELTATVLRKAVYACLVTLVVTGIPLLWLYRPPFPQEWLAFYGIEQSWLDRVKDDWLREVHNLASVLLMPLTVASLVVAVLRRSMGPVRSTVRQIGIGVVGLAVTIVGGVTGLLVAWEQLGLRAVTVGDSRRGALAVARSDVRFAIVGGAQIDPGSYLRMLAVHTILVPLLGILAVVLLRRWKAGGQVRPTTSGQEALVPSS